MSERTDQELLILTQRGDRSAAAELFTRMAPRLRVFARSILNDEFLASDVVQCVFVKILDLRRAEVRKINDPLAWLIRSTRNEALNLIRTDRRARARATIHASMRDAAGLGGPRHQISARSNDLPLAPSDSDAMVTLLDSMDRLSPEQRELIVLKHLVGMTFDQLAVALGENRSTLSSRYQVALASLKSVLESGEVSRRSSSRIPTGAAAGSPPGLNPGHPRLSPRVRAHAPSQSGTRSTRGGEP